MPSDSFEHPVKILREAKLSTLTAFNPVWQVGTVPSKELVVLSPSRMRGFGAHAPVHRYV